MQPVGLQRIFYSKEDTVSPSALHSSTQQQSLPEHAATVSAQELPEASSDGVTAGSAAPAFDSSTTPLHDGTQGQRTQAVISPVVIQKISVSNPSPGLARVMLDGSNSTAKAGTRIVQYTWAVVQLPNKTRVTSATGRVVSVMLEPGQYQVGLLVADSENGNGFAVLNLGELE